MGRVSTTSYSEAKATGKIYLDKAFYSNIGDLTRNIPKRCKQCASIMPEKRNGVFCSQWCKEESMIEKDVKYNDKHRCVKCGGIMETVYRKHNRKFVRTGVASRCFVCNPVKNKTKVMVEDYFSDIYPINFLAQ